MLTCIAIYTVVAISGVIIASHGTSAEVPGNVLNLFAPNDKLGLAMRAAISVAVTLVYPMLCLPCRSTLDHLLFGGGAMASKATLRHNLETVAVVSLTLLLATLESDLSKVFGFTGSTAGAIICYLLPLTVYMRLRAQQTAAIVQATQRTAVLCRVTLLGLTPLVFLTTWQVI
eukprot:TRINITY_DN32793_c0_g1_i1.p1 TRINITY_DN32793_c0_g1~~TRINITY_DN32793_c0_g1_i1.p1  ORF type:complete len:194 (-),score=22.91 TRINITY_DN32793_c0_g1_i1:75-593(-)